MMKPGQIFKHKKLHFASDYEVKYGFVTSDNKIKIDYWTARANAAGILLFLEFLNYSEETTVHAQAIERPQANGWVSAMASVTMKVPPLTLRKEFEKTGKIPGGVFLNGDGRKIWISCYDIVNALSQIISL